MVDHIKRDKSDIYGMPILGFLFKDQTFLTSLKLGVLFLFGYAIIYGFIDPSDENVFTTGLFWGLFWPFFMVVTLSTFGRVFCGICPHGYMGKLIMRVGLNKKMPKSLRNPYIGLFLLFIGWWALYYVYPGLFKTPFATALLFSVMTIIAAYFYYVYSSMDYCKYICPIGAVSRAFSKVSFTWLGTYKSECSSCRTFECATACKHDLKPFTFDDRNSMTDCTLCMDCSAACEAVSFKFKKPSFSLFGKLQTYKVEVWAFILISAAISITMSFHHALGRTAIVESFPWVKTARYLEGMMSLGSADIVGLSAFVYAVVITLSLTTIGMYLASKIMQTDYSSTFYSLGHAFAPIFIIGGLSHMGEFFFYHYASDSVNAFIQAFHLPVAYMEALATRKDKWVHVFELFNHIAAIWALAILYGRIKLLKSKPLLKMIAFPFAAAFILFYAWLNFYKGYVFATYGVARGGHAHHGQTSEKLFQSVAPEKAIILQEGPQRTSGVVCGMDLPTFYKTNHAADLDGKTRQYCSLHCLSEELIDQGLPLDNIRVIDAGTLKFIDVRKAFYVVGSHKKGTMSRTSKYAFGTQAAAVAFAKANGGTIMDFDQAAKMASKEPTH